MAFSILEMLNMIRPMKLKLALAVLFLSSLAPWCAEAAINSAPPSAQIQPILAPCLDAILAPLEANPRMPRVQVETLRANFAASLVTATIYMSGLRIQGTWASDGQRHSHIKFKHKDLTGDFSQDGKTFTTTSGEVFTHAG